MKKYKLQIIMPSYNKQEYIQEAIDSVLAQKIDCEYQLVITDDGSTDQTVNIIQSYINRYPERIVLLPSNKNYGLLHNILKAYRYMDCEYFCCLDPDDYYTDVNFLQKAINFLDSNNTFNIYASNVKVRLQNDQYILNNSEWQDSVYDSDFTDMLSESAPLGNTVGSVFRNIAINQELICKLEKYIGNYYAEHAVREDDFRNRIHVYSGKAHYVNECVGVYRYTPTGLYQGSNVLRRINMKISAYVYMYEFFNKQYPEFMVLAYNHLKYAVDNKINNDFNNLFKYGVNEVIEFMKLLIQVVEYDNSFGERLFVHNKPNKKHFLNLLLRRIKKWFRSIKHL